jgi:hypothetical protein
MGEFMRQNERQHRSRARGVRRIGFYISKDSNILAQIGGMHQCAIILPILPKLFGKKWAAKQLADFPIAIGGCQHDIADRH